MRLADRIPETSPEIFSRQPEVAAILTSQPRRVINAGGSAVCHLQNPGPANEI